TFAEQAVIAMENSRLFTELEQRNREVTEALEQQTAVAQVLEAISRAPTAQQTAFKQICEAAARLLGADRAILWHILPDRFALLYTTSPYVDEAVRARFGMYENGTPPGAGGPGHIAMVSGQPVQVQGTADELEDVYPEQARV